ncbi:YncE family protein [Candidatus Parvarchaeota archaeon]|nr:YncE family protein [Candidatus Acidifodinimicrobium mancum]
MPFKAFNNVHSKTDKHLTFLGKNKRSQSALEYMMTYGWAILIIVIVAVVLYSMGIFSPSSFLSFSGITGLSGFQPASAACASNGQMIVKLSNSLGYQVSLFSINVTTSSGVSVTQPESATLYPGQTQEFIVFGICPKTSGSSFSDTITVAYTEPSNPIPGPYSLSGTAKGTSTTPTYNTFTAYNLPGNVPWTVEYAGMNQTTSASSMNFVSLSNSAWQIYPTTVNGVTYYPIYAAGSNISAGYNLEVDFIPMRNLWFTNNNAANVSMIYYSNNTLALNKVSGGTGLVSVGSVPLGVAIAPNGQYAYVVNGGSNSVSVISTSSNSVVSTITVGSGPVGVAITPNGQYAYVTNQYSNTVSVISTSSNSVVSTITVGAQPIGVAIAPNGQYAYVTNWYSNTVSVISTSSNSVVSTIPVGTNPLGVTITPNGQYVYVANWSGTTVSVVSTFSDSVVSTITVGTDPFGVAIAPNGQYAYVANAGSATVSVISISSNSVVTAIPVGSSPHSVAITPNGQYAYVTNYGSNTVSVISTSSNSVVTTITGTPAAPCSINYGPLGSTC